MVSAVIIVSLYFMQGIMIFQQIVFFLNKSNLL